jgi:transposase
LYGYVSAFTWAGGVPKSILYDNTKIAVTKILGDGKRKRTKAFSELQSHYLFEDRFGRPAKSKDKDKVEGLVGYTRRNIMLPLPRVHSIDEFNAKLAAACHKRQVVMLRGQKQSIGERPKADRRALMTLPNMAFDPCEKVATRVNSLS